MFVAPVWCIGRYDRYGDGCFCRFEYYFLSMRRLALMIWYICCIFACPSIATPPWYIPYCSGFARPGKAADVMILYPFRAISRPCGMCVSWIASLCTFRRCSSHISSFCLFMFIRLSGFMLIIVSVFSPVSSAMALFRAVVVLYWNRRDRLCFALLCAMFVREMRHGFSLIMFAIDDVVRCLCSFRLVLYVRLFAWGFSVFSLACVFVFMWCWLLWLFG